MPQFLKVSKYDDTKKKYEGLLHVLLVTDLVEADSPLELKNQTIKVWSTFAVPSEFTVPECGATIDDRHFELSTHARPQDSMPS